MHSIQVIIARTGRYRESTAGLPCRPLISCSGWTISSAWSRALIQCTLPVGRLDDLPTPSGKGYCLSGQPAAVPLCGRLPFHSSGGRSRADRIVSIHDDSLGKEVDISSRWVDQHIFRVSISLGL